MKNEDALADAVSKGMARDKEGLQRLKLRLAGGGGRIPSDAEVLKRLPEETREALLPLLRTKPSRALSGVTVVALMTSPERCPHGRCTYCPGGVEAGTPQSYTGKEPAAMRALQSSFDPFGQVRARVEQYRAIGHRPDKVDMIVMGGTFTTRPLEYQESFIRRAFDGLNGEGSADIEAAHRLNETAPVRCIGLTVETRPDACGVETVRTLLSFGVTRVELGVQSTYDGVLVKVRRGHTVADTERATRLLKDSGLKVGYHMMPGLPGTTREMEPENFRRLFAEERFRPDMLKIYPCLVIKGTTLYEEWRRGEFTPLDAEAAAVLLAEVKRDAPPWVRIQRIQRDIPAPLIEAGVKKSNLRQLAQAEMARRGWRCRCIRCREVGHRVQAGVPFEPERIGLVRQEYRASGGTEVFLSFDETKNDHLIGYARLRLPNAERGMRNADSAFLRELKVFGWMIPVGEPNTEGTATQTATPDPQSKIQNPKSKISLWQHRGYGRQLLAECERIAGEEWGVRTLLVNSGVGAREYYKKHGYSMALRCHVSATSEPTSLAKREGTSKASSYEPVADGRVGWLMGKDL